MSTREHIRWVLPSPHSPSPGHDPFSFCPGSCRISRMHRPHSLPPIWLWHVAHSPHGPCAFSLNLPSSPTFAIPEVGDRHLVGSGTRRLSPRGRVPWGAACQGAPGARPAGCCPPVAAGSARLSPEVAPTRIAHTHLAPGSQQWCLCKGHQEVSPVTSHPRMPSSCNLNTCEVPSLGSPHSGGAHVACKFTVWGSTSQFSSSERHSRQTRGNSVTASHRLPHLGSTPRLASHTVLAPCAALSQARARPRWLVKNFPVIRELS